jgi:hypothetical protein
MSMSKFATQADYWKHQFDTVNAERTKLEHDRAALREACEAAYKHIADRPRDEQWIYDEPLRRQLEEALGLKAWEKYR